MYIKFQNLLSDLKNQDFNTFIKNSSNILNSLQFKNNILIILPDNIEEIILAIPFMQEIQKIYNSYNIYVFSSNEEIIKYFIKDINIIYEKINTQNIFTIIQSCIEISNKYLWDKGFKYTFCPSFNNTIDILFLNYFSGAENKIGYSDQAWTKYFTENELSTMFNFTKDEFSQLLLNSKDFPLEISNDIDKQFYLINSEYRNTNIYTINYNKIILGISNEFNRNREFSIKQYAIALLALLQNNKNLEIHIIGSENDKKYLYELLTNNIYTLNDAYRNYYSSSIEQYNFEKFNSNKIYINEYSYTEQIELLKNSLYIGNDNYLANLVIILNSHGIILLPESEEHEDNDYVNYLSIYLRKYNHSKNIHIIKPEYSLDKCIESNNYGFCSLNYPHCINEISYEQIIDKYNELIL